MWLILACLWGCGPGDPGIPGRANHWRAEAALSGIPIPDEGWSQQWSREGSMDQFDFSDRLQRVFDAQAATYNSQRECLRALRRALPEHDSQTAGWQFHVVHYPDSVSWDGSYAVVSGWRYRSGAFACFQEAPRVG